jgi:site-specific DNA-methyltransferase (adenine-specific)
MTKKKVLTDNILLGDCLQVLPTLGKNIVDLIYIDPPFFTQKEHTLKSRKDKQAFTFDDRWSSLDDYANYIEERLVQCKDVLKDTGVLFFHCDTSANFIVRTLLNKVFGSQNFVSEIVWTYKRWSNSTKALLPAHQTIFLFSKTKTYKFNHIFTDYSKTTNLDQILQKRVRDKTGTVVYMRDDEGDIVLGGEKKGVPLSDVWEIPFLNPKAKERCGYPTQKPILLLERIVELCTDEGDLVLDPFCGSGTTLVASKLLNRRFIGIDKSKDAVELSGTRVKDLVKTSSAVFDKGRDSFVDNDEFVLTWLGNADVKVVHRNAGIDCFYTDATYGIVPIKIQRKTETLSNAIEKLKKSSKSKFKLGVVIKTIDKELFDDDKNYPKDIVVVEHLTVAISKKKK